MYLKQYSESGSWTCPKTADYKIVVTAGGSAARLSSDSIRRGKAGSTEVYVCRLQEGETVSITVGAAGQNLTDAGTADEAEAAAARGGDSAFGSHTAAASLGETIKFGAFERAAVGGDGGYTPDGATRGAGGLIAGSSYGYVSIAPTGNGGMPGMPGFGRGAGGGASWNGSHAVYTAPVPGSVRIMELA